MRKMGKSLAEAFPEIAAEWHPERNGATIPIDIDSFTYHSYWWKCQKKGHEWKTRVRHRTQLSTGCPFCWGRYADSENNLKVKRPEIAEEWNFEKNGSLLPEKVTPSAGKKVWWRCKVNPLHEWLAIVSSRTRPKATGCPYCYGRLASPKNSIAAMSPELIPEWHPNKNGEYTPETVTVSSGKKYWWVCKSGHEWEAAPCNRKRAGCPYCSGNRPTNENCLATLNPSIAKEWHQKKNGDVTPFDVLPSTKQMLWWQCKRGHEWQATGQSRYSGSGCPICGCGVGSSRAELRVLTEMQTIFDNVKHRHKGYGKEIDVYVHEWNFGVEVDGFFWHKEKHSLDLKKEDMLREKGIQLFRIREYGLKSVSPMKEVVFAKEITKKSIDALLRKISDNVEFDIEHKLKVEEYIRRDSFANELLYLNRIADASLILEENTLQSLDPERAIEWHPTKNGLLSPDKVSVKSHLSVWWQCRECGMEWKTSIAHRAYGGTGCPECAKKKISDAQRELSIDVFQRIAEEKRGRCLSKEYVSQLKKLEFECAKGHRWKALPGNIRNKGCWCPTCKGDTVSQKKMHGLDVFHKIAAERGGKCLTEKRASGKGKIVFECSEGHTWSVAPSSVRMGTWCPVCAGTKKLSLEVYKMIAEARGGMCLSTEYINGKGKLRFQCADGHQWEAQASSVKARNWCKICGSKRGRAKQLIAQKEMGKVLQYDLFQ